MSVRALVVAGVACLVAAALLTAVFLPREFSILPATAFQSRVISSSAARDGVALTVRSETSSDAVIVEWKAMR